MLEAVYDLTENGWMDRKAELMQASSKAAWPANWTRCLSAWSVVENWMVV